MKTRQSDMHMSSTVKRKYTNHSITEGSLLKSSTGTVKGVFSGIKSLNDCLASKCLSISSEVICPSPRLTGKFSTFTFGACWGVPAATENIFKNVSKH